MISPASTFQLAIMALTLSAAFAVPVAQLTHLAAALLTTAEASPVNSIVLFGDPDNGDRSPGTLNNVKTFCRTGDLICAGKAIILAPHLAYARAAADFAASAL